MVKVSKHIAYQALRLALEMINRKHVDQYKYAYDYGAAVLNWNSSSWLKIHFRDEFLTRMYVWFKACKLGFLAGCRPIIFVEVERTIR